MTDLATANRLDDLLHDYFKPGPSPDGLARRVLGARRRDAEELGRLERSLAIQATPEGVSLIRTGKLDKPATAAARRLAEQAREEIVEYFAGRRAFFSVPIDLSGTPDFQRRVLEAAKRIPFGEARPYAWIAERIGHPHAVRAVGTALGRNPVPLIVPCHRVWRSDGGLGGYLFGGELKRRLAELERFTPDPRGLDRHAHRLPRGVSSGRLHAPGSARGLRIGRGRALGGLSALQDLQAAERGVSARPSRRPSLLPSMSARLAGLDWAALEAQLDERGYARTPPLLTDEECGALVKLYGEERRFRSRVDMARYRFGVGEYQYFASPLPGSVAALRAHAYPHLAAIANRWESALGAPGRYPADLAAFLRVCAEQGQTKPTPLLLRYTGRGLQLPTSGSLRRRGLSAPDDLGAQPPRRRFRGRREPARGAAAARPVARRGHRARAGGGAHLPHASSPGARRQRVSSRGDAAWREPDSLGGALHARRDLSRRRLSVAVGRAWHRACSSDGMLSCAPASVWSMRWAISG